MDNARASSRRPIGPGVASFYIIIQCEIQFGISLLTKFHILSLVLGTTHKPKQNCDCCQRQKIASKKIYFRRFCKCDTGQVSFKASLLWIKWMNEKKACASSPLRLGAWILYLALLAVLPLASFQRLENAERKSWDLLCLFSAPLFQWGRGFVCGVLQIPKKYFFLHIFYTWTYVLQFQNVDWDSSLYLTVHKLS